MWLFFNSVVTLGISIFLQYSRNHLSYPSIIMVMRFNIEHILIHSSKGADLVFNGLITILHCELAFLKVKDSITVCLASQFVIILFTAEVHLCRKSVNVSFGTWMTLGIDSIFFHTSSILPQAFKAAAQHKARVWQWYRECFLILA